MCMEVMTMIFDLEKNALHQNLSTIKATEMLLTTYSLKISDKKPVTHSLIRHDIMHITFSFIKG